VSLTKIEWTQRTWNPVRGCSAVSPGCKHCYAERIAARNFPGHRSPTTGEPFAIINGNGPHWTGKVELIPSMLDIPVKRKKPTTWFVNSMSDLFHEGLAEADIDQVFARMALCGQHTFQVLTKRPKKMAGYFNDIDYRAEMVGITAEQISGIDRFVCQGDDISARWKFPLPNVWLGVSVEDQQRADERIPLLLQTPAAIRFLSIEPLLGPVDLSAWLDPCSYYCEHDEWGGGHRPERSKIDWVIVGGESGSGARPMHPDWVRTIRDQSINAGVPFFFKQWGVYGPSETARTPLSNSRVFRSERVHHGIGMTEPALMYHVGKKKAGRTLDGRTWDQMPGVSR